MPFCARSRVAVHLSVFLSCVSFAIVLPSLWPYLASLSARAPFLAVVVAAYSVGEAAGALLFGRLADARATRPVVLLAAACALAGSLLYVLADLARPAALAPHLVLLARFLHGAWTGGTQAAQTAYLAAVLPPHSLTPAIVALNAYACLGFVLGPVFGLACNLLPNTPPLTPLTAPGYFVLASAVIIVALFVFVFDEAADRAQPPTPVPAAPAPLLPNTHTPLLHAPSPARLALAVCNLVFFVHFFGFALQETVTTPLVQSYYGWSLVQANALFTLSGVCALLSFLLMHHLSRHLSDRLLTAVSLLLAAAGYALLVSPAAPPPPPVPRFLAAFLLISVAFPLGRAATVALYTKLLSPKRQGAAQGLILAVGAVARILGPFWAVRALVVRDGPARVFASTAALFAGCLVILAAAYSRLRV